MLQDFFGYFDYAFVRYAFIVSILISIISALFGTSLVLKKFSFVGDSLSHVAFCITAVASVLNLTNNIFITLPGTIICSAFLLNENTNKKSDANLALISVSSLALGYMVMNIFSTNSNVSGDVCKTLFGSISILTLNINDVYFSIILSVVTILIFILLYNQMFSVTFDTFFAKSSGLNVKLINFIFSALVATIIVLAMNLVGSLLITALVVFPALCAMKMFNNFKKVTICAVVISVICTLFGLSFSILFSTPVGSSIVTADLICYILFLFISKIGGRVKNA